MSDRARTTLFVVDGAIDATGAVISAGRQSELTNELVETFLVLPDGPAFGTGICSKFSGVIRLPILSLRRSFSGILAYFPALIFSAVRLKREMRERDCRLVQFNDFNLAQGSLLRLLGYRGRIVTLVRIDPRRYGLIGRLWLALARWSSDELVVVSKFIASRLPANYDSTLIYDAVPIAPRPPRSQIQQFLYIGNYIEGKGQDDAIRAFHLIAARFPSAKLRFHGSDMGLAKNRAYRSGLARLAEEGDGKGRIILGEFVDSPGPVYDVAYAALNFSHSESFSLTCAEACAHGLPIIATKCGGPEEIIMEGVTGYLVPVSDVDAMAARMSKLLDDPARAEAMGIAGRHLVGERFGTTRFRSQMLEIFKLI